MVKELSRAERAVKTVNAGMRGKASMDETCLALKGLSTDELEYVAFATRQPISRLERFQSMSDQPSLL